MRNHPYRIWWDFYLFELQIDIGEIKPADLRKLNDFSFHIMNVMVIIMNIASGFYVGPQQKQIISNKQKQHKPEVRSINNKMLNNKSIKLVGDEYLNRCLYHQLHIVSLNYGLHPQINAAYKRSCCQWHKVTSSGKAVLKTTYKTSISPVIILIINSSFHSIFFTEKSYMIANRSKEISMWG